MTVEKSIVARWIRTPGYVDDADGRALARKRVRFAFPTISRSSRRSCRADSRTSTKNTDEGRGLRALREIRVQASPPGEAAAVSVLFWFVRFDAETSFDGKSWADLLKAWPKLVPPSGRFTAIDGQAVTLDDHDGRRLRGQRSPRPRSSHVPIATRLSEPVRTVK